MNVPNLINAEQFKPSEVQSLPMASRDGIKWYFARGSGYSGLYLYKRLRLAWLVFTGRYDALVWGDGQ